MFDLIYPIISRVGGVVERNNSKGRSSWLDQPVQLHSSRNHTCHLSKTDCAYRNNRWRDWYASRPIIVSWTHSTLRYQADHVYALGTVCFCLSFIAIFTLIHIIARFSPPPRSQISKRVVALFRYVAYKGYCIRSIRWITPSLGILGLISAGVLFMTGKGLTSIAIVQPNGSSYDIRTKTILLACV
jgi:hypothetical protein